MEITAHTLVRNEERYLWFAVTSVIDYLDEMLLWDTGSTDGTWKVIKYLKEIYREKIKVEQVGKVDIDRFTEVRALMLEETESPWVFILDGDEIWWDERIAETTKMIRNNLTLETVVSSYRNVIGDIYHYQGDNAARYKIDGRQGNFTIRAMSVKNIPGLAVKRPHGKQGYFDSSGKLIQDRNGAKRAWTDGVSFLHFTHMIRSRSHEVDKEVPKRGMKYKYELGVSFPLDYYYPESFFRPRPEFIPSPWERMSKEYFLKALLMTPLRNIRRKLPTKSGY